MSMKSLLFVSLSALVIGCGGAGETPDFSQQRSALLSSSTSPLAIRRSHAAATTLLDGRVLVSGGAGETETLSSTEIYDPKTNTWTSGPPMNVKRYDHTMTTLNDGKVIALGGAIASGTGSVELYDGTKWTPIGGVTMPKLSFSRAFTQSDGTVVVLGSDPSDPTIAGNKLKVFIYTPSTGAWTTGKTASYSHNYGALVKLADDSILAVAGVGPASSPMPYAERFVASTNTWISAGSVTSRTQAMPVAVPGGALVLGGKTGSSLLTDVDFYDAATNTWKTLTPMNTPRHETVASLLPSGAVFLAGSGNNTAELYDVKADKWTLTNPLPKARTWHAVATTGEKVLLIGGQLTPEFAFIPPTETVVEYRQSKTGETCSATIECAVGTCSSGVCTGTTTPPTDTGVPPTDTGTPATDTGTPSSDSGTTPTTDTGSMPKDDTGITTTDSGPTEDSDVPATDAGGDAKSDAKADSGGFSAFQCPEGDTPEADKLPADVKERCYGKALTFDAQACSTTPGSTGGTAAWLLVLGLIAARRRRG